MYRGMLIANTKIKKIILLILMTLKYLSAVSFLAKVTGKIRKAVVATACTILKVFKSSSDSPVIDFGTPRKLQNVTNN